MKSLEDIIRNIKILYVEDEKFIREPTFQALSKIFKDVQVASDGEEALKLFNKHNNFDIIVTDINMPNMNGLELIKHIRNINSNFPITITTAHNESRYLLEAINLGVNGFVLKPMDIIKLSKTISSAVEPKILKNELESVNTILLNDLERKNYELNTILDTQENLIVILNKNNIHLLNQRFLKFFGKKSIDDTINNIDVLSELFLESDNGFLFSKSDFIGDLNKLILETKNIFIKMKNFNNEIITFELDIKTFNYEELNYILTFTDVTSYTNEISNLKYKIDHDDLTSIYTKEFFMLALEDEINRSLRYLHDFSVAMIEVDNFDKLNHDYGYEITNEMLFSLANLSKDFLRETDTISRWENSKFIILMPETKDEHAIIKLNKLKALIKNKKLFKKIPVKITISCGITQFDIQDNLNTVCQRANDALFDAINTSNDKIVIK